LETYAKLLHRRDVGLPYALARLRAMEAALIQFSERGPEQRRMAANDLHRVANARKAFSGQYQGLLDPAILARKQADESALIQRLPAGAAEPWTRIAEAQKKLLAFDREYFLFERGDAFFSELFSIARHLSRLTAEIKKPNAERLREYRESNLESLKFQLFSPAPIHPELEQAKLTASLTFLAENLGAGHPLVEKTLAGKPPGVRAAELVA